MERASRFLYNKIYESNAKPLDKLCEARIIKHAQHKEILPERRQIDDK